MGWWTAAAPYLEAAGIIVALVLGVANLAWLVIQARHAKVTLAIAEEAHAWARERRELEQDAQRREEAFVRWCEGGASHARTVVRADSRSR